MFLFTSPMRPMFNPTYVSPSKRLVHIYIYVYACGCKTERVTKVIFEVDAENIVIDFTTSNLRFHIIVIGFITVSSISRVIKMGWGGGGGL